MKKSAIGRVIFGMVAVCVMSIASSCTTMTREEQEKMLRLDREVQVSDMSSSQLIEAMQKAMDPQKKFYNAQKYIMKQRTVSEHEEESRRITQVFLTEIRYAKPDSIRWTHFRDGIPFLISLCKNGEAWNINPENRKYTKLPEGLGLNLFRTSTAMLNPSKTYLDIFKSVEISSVYEDGRRCYRLVCQAFDDEIAPYVVYVDAETFLTCKLETIIYGNDGSQSLYTSIPREYTWYENNTIRMPAVTVVKTSSGQDVSTITDFHINPNIPDSDFELPARFSPGD